MASGSDKDRAKDLGKVVRKVGRWSITAANPDVEKFLNDNPKLVDQFIKDVARIHPEVHKVKDDRDRQE